MTFPDLHDRAGDRGAGAGRPGAGGGDPTSSPTSASTCTASSRARRRRIGSRSLLVAEGMWSQYLEVGIGPDAEIFTKGQPLPPSAPPSGRRAPASTWNNPEPEVTLIVQPRPDRRRHPRQRREPARHRGPLGAAASAGEGQQRLLRPRPLHPALRRTFSLDDVRRTEVRLDVAARTASTSRRSRLPDVAATREELVRQLIGRTTSYPDGAALMLGTMFAPIQDRDRPGEGFTHKVDDVVRSLPGARHPGQPGAARGRVRALALRRPRSDGQSGKGGLL